jgi:thioredoxin reductase (NADPH)
MRMGAINEQIAFPTLSTEQINRLRSYGEVQTTQAGQILFQEGDLAYDFFVVLKGQVEILENSEGQPRSLAVHGPGRFLGEINKLHRSSGLFERTSA